MFKHDLKLVVIATTLTLNVALNGEFKPQKFHMRVETIFFFVSKVVCLKALSYLA